jgi:cardiolipin synthase
VLYIGKAATLNLLYAFPLLLLASHDNTLADIARPFAWAFTCWGVFLYWWAGWLYVVQFRDLIGDARREERLASGAPA